MKCWIEKPSAMDTIISGFAMHGLSVEALELFAGIRPSPTESPS